MQRLSVAFVGEVDHGKSTLIGRLLLDTGSLSARREEDARGGRVALAHLVDQLGREQDEGLTVNTAQAFLRWRGREIALVDAPGHEEFLRHMISGASAADAAVILIDAAEGVRDETRRHALLVKLLRIPQVIAVVNKSDAGPSPAEAFREAAAAAGALAGGLDMAFRAVIPASALTGLNVTAARAAWYDGPTVLEALCAFGVPDPAAGPVRFCVQDVYPFLPGQVVAGRVERGVLRPGAVLAVHPGGARVSVRALLAYPNLKLASLEAGQTGSIIVDRPQDLRRGQVLAPASDPPRTVANLRGRVFCLGPAPLTAGARHILRAGTQDMGATLTAVEERVDSGALVARAAGTSLEPLELGVLAFALDGELVVEDPNVSPTLGRFVIEDALRPIAFGMVLEQP